MSWRSIETAPRTGEHILVAWFEGRPFGYGLCGGKRQSAFDVVHWWDGDEAGWYPSCGPDQAVEPSHWMPLREKGGS
jgi:hypothetical protein